MDGKTHFADDDTLRYIAKLQRERDTAMDERIAAGKRIEELEQQRDDERKKHEAAVTINERLLSDNRILTAQRDELEQQVKTHNENFDILSRISKEELADMAQQRDELLTALKEIQATVTPLSYAAGYTAMKHIADAAIAKVTQS